MTTKNFTYTNTLFNENYNKDELKKEILKLTPCEFYLFILTNENKINEFHGVNYNYELVEIYLEYYSEKNFDDEKYSNEFCTFYNLIYKIDDFFFHKMQMQKKISNYYKDLDNEKYQPFDKELILSIYDNSLSISKRQKQYLKILETINLDDEIKELKKKYIINNLDLIHVLDDKIDNLIFDLVIQNFKNKNYNQMKNFLNILIEKNNLKGLLFMSLFYRFFEKNKNEEIKYYLKIYNNINKIQNNNFNLNLEDYFVDELGIYLESMYYLSLYYYENKEYYKSYWISLETIKFIELHLLIDYINDNFIDEFTYSGLYFKNNLSLFYINFKMYDNLIKLFKFVNNYSCSELLYDKYNNEIEFVINNWKY